MTTQTMSLKDEAATMALGASLANVVKAPMVIYLEGDLGAGKTTLTRGLLRGLGHTGPVKSPTYAIVESYDMAQVKIHHFDLYRFSDPEEWLDAGLVDLFDEQSVCLIEWPAQGEGFLPEADWVVSLSVQNQGRTCTIIAKSSLGKECLNTWLN
ncbi:MAG: tRNA (adenosine(37)-N6)-threonylcarbamoyltransferase complex ATPase subunit type 1 TsaE [Neisseriaceae bacterium]|nr:tRNA (adenosine(37)-N6)-threonylcarbamoyltransferase complex ATPase subunit type 1 TsaE [Neisseriaceae bacterium]MBP6862840.1 tRNA (adenosine(37)-N6)-threonylcarbamoyltransferase complex ATPase subunit type 1 TsaE [Neisseriaceae bacterium]